MATRSIEWSKTPPTKENAGEYWVVLYNNQYLVGRVRTFKEYVWITPPHTKIVEVDDPRCEAWAPFPIYRGE